MNLLDENIPSDQRELLSGWRIRFREIGLGIGHLGMKDSEIIPVLHALKSPTFFTLDSDFYERQVGFALIPTQAWRHSMTASLRRLRPSMLAHQKPAQRFERVGHLVDDRQRD